MAEPAPGAPRRPLVLAALAVLAGGALGLGVPALDGFWVALAAGALGFWLAARGARRPPVARAGALAMLAALFALQGLRASERRAPPEPPTWRAGRVEGLWRPAYTSGDGARGTLVGAAAAGLEFELPPGAARAGEHLRLEPSGTPARPARGPVAAPSLARASVPVAHDELERVAPADAGSLARLWRGGRAAVGARCDDFADPWAGALARALLLGDRARLTPGAADLFTRTGLRHLLAVSGLHVALFVGLVAAPLVALAVRAWVAVRPRWRPWRGELTRVGVALALLAYAPLAGGAPPVRRAALAAALALVAPLVQRGRTAGLGRWPDALSVWSAALVLECLADPTALLAPGVQLSYAATLGIAVGAAPLARRGPTPTASGLRAPLAPGLAGRLRRAVGVAVLRLARSARLALAVSVAAGLTTLPIVWTHFGEWSPVGLALTPLALVLLAGLVPLGWLAVAAPCAPTHAAFETLAHGLRRLAELGDRLPGTPCPLPERPAWLLVASAGLALAGIALGPRAPRSVRWIRWSRWSLRSSAGLACLVLLPWTSAPARLELVALDVGHGTAVLWRAPDASTWIFDAGSRDRTRVGRAAIAPLLARWDGGRPAVVLSHGDRDHAGGLAWLVERHRPRLWVGALPAPLSERLPHDAPRLDLGRAGSLVIVDGARLRGLGLRLLRGGTRAGNEGSRSLWLTLEGRGALLCGDAEQEGLGALLESWGPDAPTEVLLLPHHGSHTPWLGPLLTALRPAEVWISGSGEPPVARELDRRGQPWRSTGTWGPLIGTLGRAPGGPGGTELAGPRADRPLGPGPGAGS